MRLREFSTVDQSQMQTGGVKNRENIADVIYGHPLMHHTVNRPAHVGMSCKYSFLVSGISHAKHALLFLTATGCPGIFRVILFEVKYFKLGYLDTLKLGKLI